eukprot:2831124-Rhodomonas_salina.4
MKNSNELLAHILARPMIGRGYHLNDMGSSVEGVRSTSLHRHRINLTFTWKAQTSHFASHACETQTMERGRPSSCRYDAKQTGSCATGCSGTQTPPCTGPTKPLLHVQLDSEAAPANENMLAGQSAHVVDPSLAAKVPASQVTHSDDPNSAVYLPGEQAKQLPPSGPLYPTLHLQSQGSVPCGPNCALSGHVTAVVVHIDGMVVVADRESAITDKIPGNPRSISVAPSGALPKKDTSTLSLATASE